LAVRLGHAFGLNGHRDEAQGGGHLGSGSHRKDFHRDLRHLDRREVARWIQVVLTRFVYNSDQLMFSRTGVWDHLVDFSHFQ